MAAISSPLGGVGGVLTSVNIVGNTGIATKAFGLPDQGDPVAKMSGCKQGTILQPGKLGSKVFLTFIASDVYDEVFSSVLAVDNLRFE